MKQCLKLYRLITIAPLILGITSCYKPPYNDFQIQSASRTATTTVLHYTAVGAGVGTVVAAAASGNLATGALIGAGVGVAYGLHTVAQNTLLEQLAEQSVQVVQYNHQMTVIIPTDKFYVFDTAELNEIQYPALMNIVSLVQSMPHGTIYVAGFNDDVGSKRHKRYLSEQRAQTMAAFLWAYGFSAYCFDVAGYGDKNDIADNHLIHGSAMNRRVELQWRI